MSGSGGGANVATMLRGRTARILSLGAVYLAVSMASRYAFPGFASATAIWPASGIALGALLLWGGDLLPGVFLGAFGIALVKTFTAAGGSVSVGLLQDALVATGSTIEAWVGLKVIGRRLEGPQPFDRVADMLRLGAVGGLFAASVGATFGTAVVHAVARGAGEAWAPMWLTWWMGDASGILLFAPLVLAWFQDAGRESVAGAGERSSLAAALVLLGLVAVRGWFGAFGDYLLSYALAIIALWAALRMGTRATTVTNIAVATIMLFATLAGRGPFRGAPSWVLVLRMDAFVALIAMVALVLNASLREWRVAESRLRGAYDDLELRVQERSRELSEANAELRREMQERQRAQDTVRMSEARLRAAFENVPFDLWMLDRNGTYIFQNPVSRKIAGDISGRRPDELPVPRDIWARWKDNYLRAFAGEIVNWEGSYDHHGDREYRREALAPIVLDGETVGVVGIGIDTTAQHRADAQLRESAQQLREREEMYRLLFESELNAVVIVDMETRHLVEANDAFLRLYGYSREEVPSIQPKDMSAEPAKTEAAVGALLHDATVLVDERLHRRKDGTVFPVELYTRTFTLRGRLMACAVIRDLTERRRADAERQRLAAQIQQAQKLESLGVLAGGIAHDFNNLLVGILGNAGLALLELPEGSPTRETVAQIERAAVRAADLTRQMLAYSGKGRFVIERLDLSQLVREMVKLVQSVVSKKANLALRLTEPLAEVEADATQLRQVVMNLITNASDALGDDAGSITISTGVVHADRAYLASAYLDEQLPPGEYVFLEVVDDGVGMDADTRARIFDPFFTTKFTGRGLGLAAVLGIVRGHRGTIHVDSLPGQGSTFRLLLPKATEAESRAPAHRTPEPAVEWRGQGTILLVDDEPGVLSAARRILERSGFTVLTAADGREAVDQFVAYADVVRCVLLDMTMPRLGGEETMREMRKLRPKVPVILSSGFSEQEVAERFSGEQPSGFVQKPYRPADLVLAVRRAMDGR